MVKLFNCTFGLPNAHRPLCKGKQSSIKLIITVAPPSLIGIIEEGMLAAGCCPFSVTHILVLVGVKFRGNPLLSKCQVLTHKQLFFSKELFLIGHSS